MDIIYNTDNNGFFSNFTRILDWLWLKKHADFKINFGINWKQLDESFLKDYFNFENDSYTSQPIEVGSWAAEHVNHLHQRILAKKVPFYYNYPSPKFATAAFHGFFVMNPNIYLEKDFRLLREEMHSVYHDNFSLNVNKLTQIKTEQIQSKKTLGVHIRTLQHYMNSLNYYSNGIHGFDNDTFVRTVVDDIYDEFINGNYEQVYLASDSLDFFNLLETKIHPTKILKINYLRLNGNFDWSQKNNNILDEYLNVLSDVYNLSSCEKIIGSSSNVFLFTLYLNKSIDFSLIKSLKSYYGA